MHRKFPGFADFTLALGMLAGFTSYRYNPRLPVTAPIPVRAGVE
jgi:hypothetical protein